MTPNDFRATVEGWTERKLGGVHTSIPGTIVSYDPAKNRAKVKPTGVYKTADRRDIAWPVIHNAPVLFPVGMGGRAGVTFPVKAGDGCLILFAEQQIDDFLSSVDSTDARRHSLNDAICIPGLYSGAATANAGHPDEVCIQYGGALLRLSENSFVGDLADGTHFEFGGLDLVVNGVSLRHHVHSGIESGPSNTGEPVK